MLDTEIGLLSSDHRFSDHSMDPNTAQDEFLHSGSPTNDHVKQVRLGKTLLFIRKASTDSEKLAGIFLVTEILRTRKLDGKVLNDVFDAIGIPFIRKLIHVNKERPGSVWDEETRGYIDLALNLLTVFSENADESTMSDLLPIIPDIVDMLVSHSKRSGITDSDSRSVEDSLRILCNLVKSPNGGRNFLQYPPTSVLLQDEAMLFMQHQLLVHIVTLAVVQCKEWAMCKRDYCIILLKAFGKLVKEKDADSFDLLERISCLMMAVDGHSLTEIDVTAFLNQTELNNLFYSSGIVIKETLQSVVPMDVKRTALAIAHAFFEQFGMHGFRMCGSDVYIGMLRAVLATVSVEMEIMAENDDTILSFKDGSMEIICLSISEKIIIDLVSTDSIGKTNSNGSNEHFIKAQDLCRIKNILNSLMNSVVKYFNKEINKCCSGHIFKDLKVVAAYRAICAWLAEETEALRQEVRDLLPSLLRLAAVDFEDVNHSNFGEDISRPVLLQFIMPVLCHLSAEASSRNILHKENFHTLLLKYFDVLVSSFHKQNLMPNLADRLETLLGVFLNISVTELKFTARDQTYQELLGKIITLVVEIYSDQKEYHVQPSMILLALTLLRNHASFTGLQQNEVMEFIKTSALFLFETCPLHVKYQEAMDDTFSELWAISVSMLKECIAILEVKPNLTLPMNIQEELVTLHKGLTRSADDKDILSLLAELTKLCLK